MTMKSIRKDLFSCLNKHGEQTMDELETRLPGYSRSQISNNINAARNEELIGRDKDVVTGQPAYKLTATGKKRLETILAKSGGDACAQESTKYETQPNLKSPSETQAPAGKAIDVPVVPKAKPAPAKAPEVFTQPAHDNEINELRAQLKHAESMRDAHFESAETAMKRVDELVVESRELKAMLDSVAESSSVDMKRIADLEDDIRRQTQRATAAERNRDDLKAERDKLREECDDLLVKLLEQGQATEITEAAVGYIVRVTGRKPRICVKPDSARNAALSSAKTYGRADVLALVPVGSAKRDAVFYEASREGRA